jgi:hypothetical protein
MLVYISVLAPGTHPRDLTTIRIENNPQSVRLNWQPPVSPNGQITGRNLLRMIRCQQVDKGFLLAQNDTMPASGQGHSAGKV